MSRMVRIFVLKIELETVEFHRTDRKDRGFCWLTGAGDRGDTWGTPAMATELAPAKI